jgi:hypothetical protein
MRELIIQKYKDIIDRMNDYWKGWGNKNHMIEQYPDFDSLDDETLLLSFLQKHKNSCQPRG